MTTSGRGVAIAVRDTPTFQFMTLANIRTGTRLDAAASGLLITGDLILQTREGGSQVLELTSFYVPCNPAHRGAFLPVLQADLESGNRMHPARASAMRLVGGDGNGVWSAEEVVRIDAVHTLRRAPDYGWDFKRAMERLSEMVNLKPPASFNVDTEDTHLTGTLGKRLDYVFANIDVGRHVHHTIQSDGLFLQVGSDPTGTNSTHYRVVADLPLSRLGNAMRPPAYHRATFSRLEINLANRERRYENIGKAKPAVATWLGGMHPALHAAYIGEGAYAAASGKQRLATLLKHLPAALASITELATSGMRVRPWRASATDGGSAGRWSASRARQAHYLQHHTSCQAPCQAGDLVQQGSCSGDQGAPPP
jgi:hypothetical protein